MKIHKVILLAYAVFAMSFCLNAQSKVNYEDITADAVNLSPEKYKQKPLCITTKYKTPVSLEWYFQQRSNISSDKYFQLPVDGFKQLKIVAKRQEFSDDLAKIKPNSTVKMYGRVKHISRVSSVKPNVYYFELEKIEDLTNFDKDKDDIKKSDSSKSEKAK